MLKKTKYSCEYDKDKSSFSPPSFVSKDSKKSASGGRAEPLLALLAPLFGVAQFGVFEPLRLGGFVSSTPPALPTLLFACSAAPEVGPGVPPPPPAPPAPPPPAPTSAGGVFAAEPVPLTPRPPGPAPPAPEGVALLSHIGVSEPLTTPDPLGVPGSLLTPDCCCCCCCCCCCDDDDAECVGVAEPEAALWLDGGFVMSGVCWHPPPVGVDAVMSADLTGGPGVPLPPQDPTLGGVAVPGVVTPALPGPGVVELPPAPVGVDPPPGAAAPAGKAAVAAPPPPPALPPPPGLTAGFSFFIMSKRKVSFGSS